MNRYIYRIVFPSILAGFVTLVAIFFMYPSNIEAPQTSNQVYPSAISERGAYFFRTPEDQSEKPNTSDAPSQVEDEAQSVITALEPKIMALEERIEALDEANFSNWRERREEVVNAWENLQTTYENIATGTDEFSSS